MLCALRITVSWDLRTDWKWKLSTMYHVEYIVECKLQNKNSKQLHFKNNGAYISILLCSMHHTTNWKLFIIRKANHSWNYFSFYQIGWVGFDVNRVQMGNGKRIENHNISTWYIDTSVRAYQCECFQDYYCLKCKLTLDPITKCHTMLTYSQATDTKYDCWTWSFYCSHGNGIKLNLIAWKREYEFNTFNVHLYYIRNESGDWHKFIVFFFFSFW